MTECPLPASVRVLWAMLMSQGLGSHSLALSKSPILKNIPDTIKVGKGECQLPHSASPPGC